MITFRYHVVTLVAVFMAIGLGVLFGATFIDQNIVDSLRAAQVRLGDRNDALRGRIVDLEDENEALQTFTGSTRDLVVRGSLSDVPVVIVSFDSTPGDALDAVRETLTLAGARLDGQLTLSNRLDLKSDDSRERLSTALGSSTSDPGRLSQEAVAQLATAVVGGNPQVLSKLLEAELVTAQVAFPATPSEQPPAVVLVGGETSKEVNERIAVPLAKLLGSGPTVTAAAQSGVDLQLLKPLREESDLRLVTVDSVEAPLGQSALAIGLKGAPGRPVRTLRPGRGRNHRPAGGRPRLVDQPFGRLTAVAVQGSQALQGSKSPVGAPADVGLHLGNGLVGVRRRPVGRQGRLPGIERIPRPPERVQAHTADAALVLELGSPDADDVVVLLPGTCRDVDDRASCVPLEAELQQVVLEEQTPGHPDHRPAVGFDQFEVEEVGQRHVTAAAHRRAVHGRTARRRLCRERIVRCRRCDY